MSLLRQVMVDLLDNLSTVLGQSAENLTKPIVKL